MKLAEDKGCQLSDLTTQDLQGINKLFEDDVQEVWDFDRYAMLCSKHPAFVGQCETQRYPNTRVLLLCGFNIATSHTTRCAK